ncbi:unnamed protein product [Angiostrongylus costaricensis]|uniref:C2H2-type domain-containing protein n=1 Tax=Angiostrongylus costaricensis TaxID=334426 RepID=A0A158PE33_ANGCS|nr:unnamed protein product [Angiostrongylus costaricensis]
MVEIAEMPSIIVDEPSACPQCPKTFANVRLLQQHQQMFHSDKSFICEICGKAFRFRSNLAEHRSVHTALKPYVCKYCGKSSRLKGNLTKHILKHHKKEQNEQIGKDDIIIKKVNKMKSTACKIEIYVFDGTLTVSCGFCAIRDGTRLGMLRSILISLGLDYSHSLDLRDSPEASASPENGEITPPFIMRRFRKGIYCLATDIVVEYVTEYGSSLHVHMTLNHGFPPPESTGSSEEKTSECEATADDGCLRTELRALRSCVCDLKSQISDMRHTQTTPKTEQMLSGMDTRIGRLEKQLEVALNSIYTLVQLTTGMNNNVTRFREDAVDQLKSIRSHLDSVMYFTFIQRHSYRRAKIPRQ